MVTLVEYGFDDHIAECVAGMQGAESVESLVRKIWKDNILEVVLDLHSDIEYVKRQFETGEWI
jgi:hypothetical protein